MVRPKQIHNNAFIGQQGINLIEQICLKMKFAWHQTNASLEAGLDGFIELREPSTGEALNSTIFVQSKATEHEFQNETEKGFTYSCDERDLDYWLKGNAPILLICSRPHTGEAYWISVKDYFRDPVARQKRRVAFDKNVNKFEPNVAPDLLKLALPADRGIYLAPEQRAERLYSNLIRVTHYPEHIWIASTDFSLDSEIREHFNERKIKMAGEWFTKDKKIISFYDLSEPPWTDICDQGTADRFNVTEWSQSDDADRRKDFVRLLNQSLRRKLHHLDIGFDKSLATYYFRLPEGQDGWVEPYRSISKKTERAVVEFYPNRAHPERPGYYRHLAFEGHFRTISQNWVLEVTPTYRFTRDGLKVVKRYEELLKGIKRLERNGAVLGQVFFIADYLGRPPELFRKATDLTLGPLLTFDLGIGIKDDDWLKREEDEGKLIKSLTDETLGLFE